MIPVERRVRGPALAFETTLLCHGVPGHSALALHDELELIARTGGAEPALIGVVKGRAVVGVSRDELGEMVAANVPKANTSNLAAVMAAGTSAATTVSATMEIAAAAGVRVFATGGIGGVHRGYADHLDVSSDLVAFSRFPVAVVSSGVKSILDVGATREALETMGVAVWGFQTDIFPEFYVRGGRHRVDAVFDSIERLAEALAHTLARTGRGVVVANPIPSVSELDSKEWAGWLAEAERRVAANGVVGRGVTPAILGALHDASGGRTLEANVALVKGNARLGAALADQLRRTIGPRASF